MHSAVISDASCLIVLFEIDALDLLRKTYGEITPTPESGVGSAISTSELDFRAKRHRIPSHVENASLDRIAVKQARSPWPWKSLIQQ